MQIELSINETGEVLRSIHQCVLRYLEVIKSQGEYKNKNLDYVDSLINGMKDNLEIAKKMVDILKTQPYVNESAIDRFIHEMNANIQYATERREEYAKSS